MRRALSLTLLLVLLGVTICAVKLSAAVGAQCGSVSLRYRTPLAPDEVQSAQEKQPGLTFWGEETVALSTQWRQAQTPALLFSGDASLVWGQPCAKGSLPAVYDSGGCALSSALAQALFGSEDVTGLTLFWNKTVYTVRGVWQSENLLALLPAQDAAFTAVELPAADEAGHDPDGWVNTVLLQSGLPSPDWTLFTAAPAFLARALALLPLVFGAIVLAAAWGKRLSEYSFPARDAAAFAVLLAVALAIPLVLSVWPQWLTPSRWSDFAWWGGMARQIAKQAEAWLVAPGIGRDLAVKTGLLAQIAFAMIQCVLCEVLRCRFRAGQRPKT